MGPIVVIPVYKGTPDRSELASLRQCLTVLGRWPVVLVCPRKLNLGPYRTVFDACGVPLRAERFELSFFDSLEAYNRLCLNEDFYLRFAAEADYMLLYQLDAWVFRDELADWCGRGYDYVGAPWILGTPAAAADIRFKAVGNGGLSLRRIAFCLNTLRAEGGILTGGTLRALAADKAPASVARKFPIYRTQERLLRAAREGRIFEDTVFALQKYTPLHAAIPGPEEALRFSFERFPSLLYERNGGRLPFGCHAWPLPAHYTFWESFISLPD